MHTLSSRLLAGSLALAAVLALPSPGDAQPRGTFSSAFASLVEDCRATALLKAQSGGGSVDLAPGKTVRIPYGVAFRFRHQVPGADFVLLELLVEGEPPRREFARETSEGSGCYEALLPKLPIDRAIELRETQGFRLGQEKRDALLAGVDALRAALLEGLFAGRYDEAFGNADSIRAFVLRDLESAGRFSPFDSLSVLASDTPATRALGPLVREGFAGRVVSLVDLPEAINLAASTSADLASLQCTGGTEAQRATVRRVADALRPVGAVRRADQINALYVSGALPLPQGLEKGLATALSEACDQDGDFPGKVEGDVRRLTTDDLAVLDQVVEAARRLVVQSYLLRSVEPIAGATTTLQRYGQLDVSNGFFGENDARLLTTLSFYPFNLRYGGEIQPHGVKDQFLLTVGYALASTLGGGDGDDGEEAEDAAAYTLGAAFRLNPLFSVGGGRWFGADDRDGWYLSVSGDLGGIPGLQQLFARSPNQ